MVFSVIVLTFISYSDISDIKIRYSAINCVLDKGKVKKNDR